MYVCMYAYKHAHTQRSKKQTPAKHLTHTHAHTHTHTRTHTHTHTHTHRHGEEAGALRIQAPHQTVACRSKRTCLKTMRNCNVSPSICAHVRGCVPAVVACVCGGEGTGARTWEKTLPGDQRACFQGGQNSGNWCTNSERTPSTLCGDIYT
jgi:hypothetical protein